MPPADRASSSANFDPVELPITNCDASSLAERSIHRLGIQQLGNPNAMEAGTQDAGMRGTAGTRRISATHLVGLSNRQGTGPWDAMQTQQPVCICPQHRIEPKNTLCPGETRSGLLFGWLIAKSLDGSQVCEADSTSNRRYLQLATGQWCSAAFATWFPIKSAAEDYLSELSDPAHRIVFLVRQHAT